MTPVAYVTNFVTIGTSAIKCAACERWFHQKCSDLTEQNINAIGGIQSIFGVVRNVCQQRKTFLRPKAIESIDKKLDALLESSQQHQDNPIDTKTKVDNATHATTVATESIIKLSKEQSRPRSDTKNQLFQKCSGKNCVNLCHSCIDRNVLGDNPKCNN